MQSVDVPDSVMNMIAACAAILAVVAACFVIHSFRAKRRQRRLLKAEKVARSERGNIRTSSGRVKKRK